MRLLQLVEAWDICNNLAYSRDFDGFHPQFLIEEILTEI